MWGRAVARCGGVGYADIPLCLARYEQSHGVCGHAALLTRKAKMLLCGRLNVDLFDGNAKSFGKVASHLLDVRRDLGTLGDERRVHVSDLVALFAEQCGHVRSKP